jgi:eukaryotic-like serine/threonine-protein kinase
MFLFRGHLWAVPFDLKRVRATGEPFLVREHVDDFPSVSDDGTLVARTWQRGEQQLVWRDRKGNEIGSIGQSQVKILYPVLSPDEKFVAVNGIDLGTTEIWIHSTVKEQKSRFTFYPQQWSDRASWSPGGDKIAYTVRETGGLLNQDIYVKQREENSEATLLVKDGFGFGWSRDENFFVFARAGTESLDVLYLHRNHEDLSYGCLPFAADPHFDESSPALSPNDRYLAYGSNESGRYEVYVSSFPEGRGKMQVSLEGGSGPRWRSDGRELYYVQEGEIPTLMAVPVSISSGQLRFGTPEPLFANPSLGGNDQTYDVSSDGQRFVLPKVLRPEKFEIVVIQNWFAEFRDRDNR